MKNGFGNSNGRDDELDDLGDPIVALTDFEREDPSSGFLARVRRSIQRRTTVAQLTSFSWSAPFLILREFWQVLIGQFHSEDIRKDTRHGGKTS
jgi:hypothetical protein